MKAEFLQVSGTSLQCVLHGKLNIGLRQTHFLQFDNEDRRIEIPIKIIFLLTMAGVDILVTAVHNLVLELHLYWSFQNVFAMGFCQIEITLSRSERRNLET